MLFILGQRFLGLLVEREPRKRILGRSLRLAGDELMDAPRQRRDVDQRRGGRIVNGDDEPVEPDPGSVAPSRPPRTSPTRSSRSWASRASRPS